MNILFLTLVSIEDVSDHGIYTDLIRCLAQNGHNVTLATATEKRPNADLSLRRTEFGAGSVRILQVYTGKVQKTNLIRKGIATLTLEGKFIRAIRKQLSDITFDLVLYSTPPITFYRAVRYAKKRDDAATYLLLKDIFPQNAADIGLMREGGLIHRYFRAKEKKLYGISDSIGCMSEANAAYIRQHNPELDPATVHVNPNSLFPAPLSKTEAERAEIRQKYSLPTDKKIFIYGGNLGKPQDIPFIIECLKTQKGKDDRYFLICGNGTERPALERSIESEAPGNVKLLRSLPRDEYDRLVCACDVGLIFLDHRFTIPNFPSRLLSYMEASLPVLACTDRSTDIGRTIVDAGFGWWCESDDARNFAEIVDEICERDAYAELGARASQYLAEHFTPDTSYDMIVSATKQIKE